MKRARDDDAAASGSAAMGDDDSCSYPHHGDGEGDDEQEEQDERRQRTACDVLLSLSLSRWPSSSSNSTSCSVQQNDHAAGTAAPPPNKPRRRWRRGTDEEFECQTCGRRFPTFQALGGHRTSHLRRPAMTKKQPRSSPKAVLVHACGMCGLGFSTGHPCLGGHMRRHRLGRADSMAGFPSADLDHTQIIVHGRPTSASSSLQLLNLFV